MRYTSVLLCLVGLAACRAAAQSKTWDGGAGSSDWFAGLNWDPDGVPGVSDAVVVDQGAPVVAGAADVNVRSLFVTTGMELVSRSLSLAEPSTISNFTLRGCCSRDITTQGLLTINGNSSFVQSTEFRGPGGTLIDGTATSEQFMRSVGSVLTIRGILDARARVEAWDGGVVEVRGSLVLRPTADMDENSGGLTRMTPAGRIGLIGTDANDLSFIDARLVANGGLLYADRGVLELRGEYTLSDTDIDVGDGGEVWLTGSFPNEIDSVMLSGDGEVELRNANNLYTGVIESDIQNFGSGLRLGSTTKLDGLLTNNGDMVMGSFLVSPGGTGLLTTSGRVDARGTSEVPITVLPGGRLDVLGAGTSLTLKAEVGILPGGEVLLGSGEGSARISKPSSGQVGRVVNEGTIRAIDAMNCAQTVQIIEVPVDLMPGGLIDADSGELRLSGGGNWSGGTIAPEGDCLSTVSVEGFNVTHSITGNVLARSSAGGSIFFGGNGHTLSVTGELRTESAGGLFGSVTLRGRSIGSGRIVHGPGPLTLASGCDLGVELVNVAVVDITATTQLRAELRNEIEVNQAGHLRFEGGTVVNNGTWNVLSAVDQQLGAGGSFVNNGEYQAGYSGANGIGHRVMVRLDNQGSVTAHDANLTLIDVAQVVDGELRGGEWTTLGSGSITFQGTSITKISGDGTRVKGRADGVPAIEEIESVEAGAEVVGSGDSTTNNELEVRGGYTWEGSSLQRELIRVSDEGTFGVGDGVRVTVDDVIDVPSVLGEIQGVIGLGALPAPATIEAPNVLSHGRLVPGGHERAGQFDFIGNVTQFADGQLLIDVGGEDNTDVVTVTGAAMLDGTLRVMLIDEFVPVGGESFAVVSAVGGVIGGFDALDLPALSAGLAWDVAYSATTVTLSVVDDCVPDWNGDGSVNTQDFLAYLNDWNTQRGTDCSGGGCSADLNGDSTVNTQDFLAFLNLWTAGC